MKLRRILLGALALMLLVGCSRDPDALKQKYLRIGNDYAQKGEHRAASLLYQKAIQVDGRFAEAYFQFGLASRRTGKIAPALRAWRRAVELRPEHRATFFHLGNLYVSIARSNPEARKRTLAELNRLFELARPHHAGTFQWNRVQGQLALTLGDYEQAANLLAQAEREKPSTPVALALAQSLAGAGREDEAEQVTRGAIASDPSFGAAYDFLYLNLRRQKRIEEAEDILVSKRDNNPTKIRFALDLAAHYWVEKRPEKATALLDELTGNLEEFPMAHSVVGDFFLRVQEYDRAVATYEEGARLVPEKRSLFRKKLAQAVAARGESDEALEQINAVLEEIPNDPQALVLRARLRMKNREVDAAIEDLRASVEQNPKNAALQYQLARWYLASGDPDSAIGRFQEAIRLRPAHIQSRYFLAVALLRKKDFAKGLAATEDLLRRRPTHFPARVLRARERLRLGETEEARAEFERLLSEQPESRPVRYHLATLDLRARDFEKAEAGFRALYQEKPTDSLALTGLLRTNLAQGRPDAAIPVLEAEIAEAPDNVSLLRALATVLVRLRDYDRAIAELEKARAANPEDGRVHLQIGAAHQLAGRSSEAEAHYRRAIALLPNSPVAHSRLGRLAESRGETGAAMGHYETVLQSSPEHVPTMARLAVLLADENTDLDRAMNLAERARRKRPTSPEVADALAWVYVKKGLATNAVEILGNLVEEHPDRARWRFHFGVALHESGDHERAARELVVAFEHDPSLRNDPNVPRSIGPAQ